MTSKPKKTPKHAGGRPVKYDAKFHPAWAASLCRRGCTMAEIAEAMGVAESTVYAWRRRYPEFSQALNNSRGEADESVVTSLYYRATGQSKRKTLKKREVLNQLGQVVTLREIAEEELPPDTTAMIYWLKNRQPDMWRDRPAEQVDESNAEAFLDAWRDA